MNHITRQKNEESLRLWHERKAAMRREQFHDWAPPERRDNVWRVLYPLIVATLALVMVHVLVSV